MVGLCGFIAGFGGVGGTVRGVMGGLDCYHGVVRKGYNLPKD